MRKTCRRCLGMLSVSPTQAGIRVRSLGLLCRATAQISASDRFCKFTVRPVANLYQRSVRSTTRSGAQGDPDTSAVTASVHQSSKTWKVLNGINDSVKWVVTLTAACVLVSFRNIYVQWCLVGSVATAFSCKVLKRLINKQRPASARKMDPGMPSSHATSLAYLATYLATANQWKQPVIAVLGIVSACFMISLRVILGYHSIPQVCAGTVLGASTAFVWHQLGQYVVFQRLASSQDGRVCLAALTVAAASAFLAKALFQAKSNIGLFR